MSDCEQSEDDAERVFVLWYSLSNLRGHISDETYKRAAAELGMPEQQELSTYAGIVSAERQ